MHDEISRSRRDANRPANNFLSSLDDVFFLPPAPLDLGTGGGRDVRNLNTDPLESPTTSAGPTTVAPPPAPRTVSPSSVGGDAGTDADPASGVAPGPSLGDVDFSGLGAARGAASGFAIAGPFGILPGALLGGLNGSPVPESDNTATSSAPGFAGGTVSFGRGGTPSGFGGSPGAESKGDGTIGSAVGLTPEPGTISAASDADLGTIAAADIAANPDIFGGADAGGDGGDGPSVICTELNRRGLMSDELYWADQMSVDSVPENTVHGYHAWAVPYVRLMRNRWVGWAATAFIRPFAVAWAEHHTGIRPNIGGWLLKHFGQPVCWALGALTGIIDISILYKGDDHA